MTFFLNFTIVSNQLTFIQKGYAAVACLIAIFLTATVTQLYAPENTGNLVASMGASAVGLSVLLMLLLWCLHPPSAATAIASIHNTVNADLHDF